MLGMLAFLLATAGGLVAPRGGDYIAAWYIRLAGGFVL